MTSSHTDQISNYGAAALLLGAGLSDLHPQQIVSGPVEIGGADGR